MTRLTDILVGLQRMAEAARDRGDDIRYAQHEENYAHISWLDQQLSLVEKVRTALLEEKKRFMPVAQIQREATPDEVRQVQETRRQVIQKGPRAEPAA